MDQYGVEDTVFCEVGITIFYKFTRTTKFAHMNGHWKDYDSPVHDPHMLQTPTAREGHRNLLFDVEHLISVGRKSRSQISGTIHGETHT